MSGPSQSFDGYMAIERLASGPMTALYCATQQLTGRKVVIKTLSAGVLPDSAFGQNIEREAAILSSLNHPNIAGLYDLRRNDAAPWLVREWVPGWTVSELLHRLRRFTPGLALGIASQVAQALAHAHAHSVVHRGLHPDCVVVTATGEAKLISFSRASGERVGRLPEQLDVEPAADAAAYTAPEQLLGEAPDGRVDVYSLGALLLHMLTGRPPDNRTRDRQGVTTDPSAAAADLDPRLRDLLARCLAQQASERLPDGRALAQALDELLQAHGKVNAQASTAQELQQVGLAIGGPQVSNPTRRPMSSAPTTARSTGWPGPLVSCLLVFVFGAVVGLTILRPWASQSKPATSNAKSGRAEVRVVVEPWARVYVDELFFDVTPFADPIVLAPGTHQFRFEHPNAPVEKRQVSVVADESILLDVNMNIPARSSVSGSSPRPEAVPSTRETGP
jgi:serine/threonine protein kinase